MIVFKGVPAAVLGTSKKETFTETSPDEAKQNRDK
jgi:hypothetical protein